jgi:hypothetical protein
MGPGIKIKVIREPDDDGLFEFEINLSNGHSSTSLVFWGYGDNFKEFGDQLNDFPKGTNETVTFELGQEKDRGQMKWAYYLLLQAFCFSASGQTAIKIVVDNHADGADYQRSEFYIKAEPLSLNKLGQQLNNWNPKNIKELEWTP